MKSLLQEFDSLMNACKVPLEAEPNRHAFREDLKVAEQRGLVQNPKESGKPLLGKELIKDIKGYSFLPQFGDWPITLAWDPDSRLCQELAHDFIMDPPPLPAALAKILEPDHPIVYLVENPEGAAGTARPPDFALLNASLVAFASKPYRWYVYLHELTHLYQERAEGMWVSYKSGESAPFAWAHYADNEGVYQCMELEAHVDFLLTKWGLGWLVEEHRKEGVGNLLRKLFGYYAQAKATGRLDVRQYVEQQIAQFTEKNF